MITLNQCPGSAVIRTRGSDSNGVFAIIRRRLQAGRGNQDRWRTRQVFQQYHQMVSSNHSVHSDPPRLDLHVGSLSLQRGLRCRRSKPPGHSSALLRSVPIKRPQKRNRSIAQAELCLNAFRHALPNPKNTPFTTLHTTASLDLDWLERVAQQADIVVRLIELASDLPLQIGNGGGARHRPGKLIIVLPHPEAVEQNLAMTQG